MDLRQLRFLVRTIESSSISNAAKALNIAQPSLSQRLRELEQELGVTLLLRTPNGIKPTPVGEMVADRARAVLRLADNLVIEARSAVAAPVGEVTVGLPTTMALHLTVPLVHKVRQTLPHVSLRVSEGMSGHIQEWVLSGRLDIAILYTSDPIAGLEMEEILSEDLWLISSPTTSSDTSPVQLGRVTQLPLVLPGPDHGLRRNIERVTSSHRIMLTIGVEVDSLPHMKRLAMDGDLHTILPRAACRDEIASGKLVARRIINPPLRRPIMLVTPRERPLSLAGDHIRMLLRDLVEQAINDDH